MHHFALDRSWANDRDLHDEIVELPGLQPRQHVDLRPAFDLEHADAVALAEHVVNGGILGIDVEVQRPVAEAMFAHQVEAFADARSEEHTSELQSLMRISYAVFCLKKQ